MKIYEVRYLGETIVAFDNIFDANCKASFLRHYFIDPRYEVVEVDKEDM